MIKQVITSGFRQIWRHPLLPVLNMLGLAGGIAVTTLILLYAHIELNYDGWVTDQERLYRVEGQFLPARGFMDNTMTPLAPKISAEISEAQTVVRVRNRFWPVQQGNFANYETVSSVDTDFFDIFPLTFIEGSADTAFPTLNSLIISEAMAQKYFGTLGAVGQTFTVNSTREYTVSGVFENLPDHTDFTFDFVVPLQERLVPDADSWSSVSLQTFIRLREGARVADVEEKLAVFVDQERPFFMGSDDDMRTVFRLFLQPFEDLHLGSRGRTLGNPLGNYATVYGFLAIAVLILAISTFNYVSLALARAIEREKEFCIRKVSGANFQQIIGHVMTESIVQTVIAAVLGLLIADDMLPLLGAVVGENYSLVGMLETEGFLIFAAATFGLGIVAGFYPALITSRFRPAVFLSGGRSQRAGVNRLRGVLVFIQFTASIALLIGAVTISRQMAHINTLDLGYDPEGLLVVRGIERAEAARSEAFKDRVRGINGIEAVTRSQVVPHDSSFSIEGFFSQYLPRDQEATVRLVSADYDFFDTYKATLVAGRQLDERYANDRVNLRSGPALADATTTRNVVLNRTAVKALGFASPESVLGEQVYMSLDTGGFASLTVVGVVEDIRFRSARRAVNAKVYFHWPDAFRAMTARLSANGQETALAELKAVWAEMYPDIPFRQSFMEESIEGLYRGEHQQLTLFMAFSGLAVVLSLVGLVGLVLNSIRHRTREISIRRVLGASVGDNLKLFTWQYLKPVLIANVPAWTVAYYFLNGWLERYPQRIDVGPDVYVLGGGTILIVTVVLITALVARVAAVSPVHALKHE